ESGDGKQCRDDLYRRALSGVRVNRHAHFCYGERLHVLSHRNRNVGLLVRTRQPEAKVGETGCRTGADRFDGQSVTFPNIRAHHLEVPMRARAFLVCVVSLLAGGRTLAQGNSLLLLQKPTLSKTHIAFAFAGDLWIVERQGGVARRLTTGVGIETDPHFSPDG